MKVHPWIAMVSLALAGIVGCVATGPAPEDDMAAENAEPVAEARAFSCAAYHTGHPANAEIAPLKGDDPNLPASCVACHAGQPAKEPSAPLKDDLPASCANCHAGQPAKEPSAPLKDDLPASCANCHAGQPAKHDAVAPSFE